MEIKVYTREKSMYDVFFSQPDIIYLNIFNIDTISLFSFNSISCFDIIDKKERKKGKIYEITLGNRLYYIDEETYNKIVGKKNSPKGVFTHN